MKKNAHDHSPDGKWEKTILLMRLSLFVLVCSIGTMVAAPTYSQQTGLDVAYEQEPLSGVLDDLRSRTDYHLVYSPEVVSGKAPVTLRKNNASVEEILNEILPKNGLAYTIESNVISIIRARTAEAQPPQQAVTVSGNVSNEWGEPLLGVTVVAVGTNIGTSTDVSGNYTINIPDARPDTRLRFTMIGMAPFETPIDGRTRVNAIMQESREQIEEVVITGMVNIFERDVVGSYNQFKMDSIYMPAYNSVTDMLQGVVPGMMVTMPSIRAGASANIVIRGRSTLLGSTDPLWVIDGIEQTDIQLSQGTSWDGTSSGMNELIGDAVSWLSPHDIETITVLKDASATAIYGSRASNGVIVITTKKGSANRQTMRFNYNISVGQQYNYGLYNLMNSKERINFSKSAYEAGVYYANNPLTQMYTYEGLYNTFLRGDIGEEEFFDQYAFLETVNTDWFDLLTRPSLNQNLSLTTSGGSDKVTYSISASYAKNNAPEKGNSSERFTGRINVDMRLHDKVMVSANLIAGLTNTEGFAGGTDPMNYATRTSRAVPAYDRDGTLAFYQRDAYYRYNSHTETSGLPYNILDDMANTSLSVENPTLQASINFRWKLLDDLTFQANAGLNINARSQESWTGENSYSVMQRFRGYRTDFPEASNQAWRDAALLKNGGILIHDYTYNRSYNVRAQFDYFKQIDENNRLTASAVWTMSSSYRNSKYNTVFGYDKYRGETIADPTSPSEHKPIGSNPISDYNETFLQLSRGYWKSTNFTENKVAVAMIVAYSLKEKYVFNANFRNDWSNAFGQNEKMRFNPAWSFGFSWRLGDEEFLRGSKLLSAAELRLTYGTQGNTASISTPEMVLNFKPIHPIFDEPYSEISRIANPFKAWERTTNWNAGLDLGLFENRILLTVDGYTRRSDAGRTFAEIPEMGGFSSNLPGTIIRNSGIEGSISFTAIHTGDWRVSINANSGKNWNKIVKEEVREAISHNLASYLNGTSESFVVPGYPVGAFWAFPYTGPDPETGIPTFRHFPSDGSLGVAPGTNPTDYMVYIGTREPDISCGLGLRINYKRLSLSTALSATLGGNGYLYNPYSPFRSGRMPDPTMNLDKELLKGWTKDNTNTDIPGLYVVPNERLYPLNLPDPSIIDGSRVYNRYDMWAQSDARVASKSTLRCRTINLTWDINTNNAKGAAANLLQKTGIRELSVSAAVNNVFLIANSKWNGMDPDMGGNMKAPRSFTLGINFGF